MLQSPVFRRKVAVSFPQLKDGERVSSFLRKLYPERTAANVSADTNGQVPAKTVENWLCRRSAPSFAHTFLLIAAYGPEFMVACMDTPPEWLTDAGRAAARASLDAKIAELEALRREIA